MINHKNNFDLLRLSAALCVALFHLYYLKLINAPWLAWPNMVFPGVTVFFIISGFLITNSWIERPEIGRYISRRLKRIYPGLIASVVFTSILMLACGALEGVKWGQFIPWFLGCATAFDPFHTPAPMRAFGLEGLPNGPWWTLPIELSFYALLPFILRGRSLAVAGLMVLSALMVNTGDFGHPHLPLNFDLRHSLFHNFWGFGIGMLGRLHWNTVKQMLGWYIWVPVYAGWLYIFGFDSLLPALPLGLAILSLAFTKPIKLAGDFSYGLYLYHAPIINYTRIIGAPWELAAGMTILAAMASWFGVERPWLRK